MATARIKAHWTRVAALGCLISQQPSQICHCHGPSLVERDRRFLKPKGKKMVWQDWLVIPLAPRYHVFMDNNPYAFAREHGTPAELLDRVCEMLGVDVWELALQEMKPCLVTDGAHE